MKLRATKGLRYATRALRPGDEFEAGGRDAKILKALGKAEDAPERVARQAPARPQAEEPDRDDMADLRNEYERVVGKRPWNGWDAATLREKMAEAGGTYGRRDMRAEE